MSSHDRIKRALMGIGLLTVVAVGAVAALVAYVWWDSRTDAGHELTPVDPDLSTGSDGDDDASMDHDDTGTEDGSDAEVASD